MPADLHIHTCFSDGTESPEEIVALAKAGGLTTIAITDHDVAAGIDRAAAKGREAGIEVVPGIELTTEDANAEVHLVAYFIDHKNKSLLDVIQRIQKSREERIYAICKKLRNLGVTIEAERVFGIAGHRAAGRPHVAKAMIEKGYVKNFKEAFDRYIDFKGPAYVAHYKLSPKEAIALILQAGGLPIFAHPAVSNCDQIIGELTEAGLAGIEVYYPSHSSSQVKHYLKISQKYGLLITGGSDYHGKDSGREIKLGQTSIPDDLMDKIRNEYIRRNKS